MTLAYYNEWEPYAARWLKRLSRRDLIEPGTVDNRSIAHVKATEIKKYNQVHLFAGIGGWSLALRLAGWPQDRLVWTGSCPCQPFSSQKSKAIGQEDKRHLWPQMFRLIQKCGPHTIFGEQIANAIGWGWFDHVCLDLESEGYAIGAAVLGAHSIGSFHSRPRLFWAASKTETMVNPNRERWRKQARSSKFQKNDMDPPHSSISPWKEWTTRSGLDKKYGIVGRPIKPGVEPLVDGVPGRVGQLHAYGNAIVPQVAAEFIKAFLAVGNE